MVKTVGSSPRLRGTRTHTHVQMRHVGIIPALAGNTSKPTDTPTTTWDHPRACGEHVQRWADWTFGSGSSPRLRGTRFVDRAGRGGPGIIPALAGNTSRRLSSSAHLRDHPRACGEHLRSIYAMFKSRGSSPRLRGTLAAQFGQGAFEGIIPALAGNTIRVLNPPSCARDHPRACGEHSSLETARWNDMGSSPRLRGTRRRCRPAAPSRGIIPALAGNTCRSNSNPPTCRDHPRACGEHFPSQLDLLHRMGSSPRLRGTLRGVLDLAAERGIIPALAGNTL